MHTFDDDGNQTIIKTATGIWQVQYNGENRPIRWNRMDLSTSSLISMSYDRMGRRVTKNAQRFVYDGYLQIANFELQTSNIKLQTFIWDPTEPVATRPLAWLVLRSLGEGGYYTHDGNKNVSEVVADNGVTVGHYVYASSGTVTVRRGESATTNTWRFSSEFAEDETGTVYYNFRHYNTGFGKWLSRDPLEGDPFVNLYLFCDNYLIGRNDLLGLKGLNKISLPPLKIDDYSIGVSLLYRSICCPKETQHAGEKRYIVDVKLSVSYENQISAIDWVLNHTPHGKLISPIYDVLGRPVDFGLLVSGSGDLVANWDGCNDRVDHVAGEVSLGASTYGGRVSMSQKGYGFWGVAEASGSVVIKLVMKNNEIRLTSSGKIKGSVKMSYVRPKDKGKHNHISYELPSSGYTVDSVIDIKALLSLGGF